MIFLSLTILASFLFIYRPVLMAAAQEGITGPAALTLGVKCERLETNDPGFTIPVNIR
jgi:hypothetical protein